MSTHKNFDRICVVVMIAALILTLVFMNGQSLGITKVIDADSDNHEDSQHFTEKDLDGNWDASSAVTITLQGTEGTISGNGAYMKDGNLVIVSSGEYVISGELTDGSIIIDSAENAKVRILLAGIRISCSDDACIRVDEADKVFLTLAEGSDNTLFSGETYSDTALEDSTGGVIFAHDDLTINGSGSLDINGGYKHGIDANDNLVLAGGNIHITASTDGLHVNDNLSICSTELTIDAQDDGIHADDSVYIESGRVIITNSYEGIESKVVEITGGEIKITCSDDGINATDGSNSQQPGDPFNDQTFNRENFTPDNFDRENFAPDNFERKEFSPQNMNPKIQNTSTSEEEELPLVSITGGTIAITNTEGNDADGIDSNGNILISGGEVYINLIGNGSNCALDYGSESGGICQINGGIVVAAGGASMIETIDSNSAQTSFTWINPEGISSAGTLTVTDPNGVPLISHEITTDFTAVTVSCPDLAAGTSYTLTIGDYSEEITLTDTVTNLGSFTSPGGFGHGGFGAEDAGPGNFNPEDGGPGNFNPEDAGSGKPVPGGPPPSEMQNTGNQPAL